VLPRIIGVSPDQGAVDLFHRLDVWVRFDVAPEGAGITLRDEHGTAVAGELTSWESGRRVVFTPDEDLENDTTYTSTLVWDYGVCESPAEWSFTVGPYGDRLPEQEPLVGLVFHADLASGTIVEPPGVGSLLRGFLVDVSLLWRVAPESDLAAGTLHLEAARGVLDVDGVRQDRCEPLIAVTAGADGLFDTADDQLARWSNPTLEASSDVLTMNVGGTAASVHDVAFEAVVHPDLFGFAGGRFEGTLDARDLVNLLAPEEDARGLCDLVFKTVGVGCLECGAARPGEFCLDVEVDRLRGAAVPGTIVRAAEDGTPVGPDHPGCSR